MPKPRELGNVARHVVAGMVDELKLARKRLKGSAVAAHGNKPERTAQGIMDALDSIDASIEAGRLLLADDQKQAEAVIDTAKQEHSKKKR